MKKIVRTRQEELQATRPNIHRNKAKYTRTDLDWQDEVLDWYEDQQKKCKWDTT